MFGRALMLSEEPKYKVRADMTREPGGKPDALTRAKGIRLLGRGKQRKAPYEPLEVPGVGVIATNRLDLRGSHDRRLLHHS